MRHGTNDKAGPMRDDPSIDRVLAEFLADQRERLGDSTYRRYVQIVDLLRVCLNGYGYQSLTGADAERWEAAFEAGDDEAFVRLCGPEQILENCGEFLGYFMVRKVAASQQELKAAGTVTKKLAGWLHERGYVDKHQAEVARRQAAAAGRDLPRADKLGEQLSRVASQTQLPVHPNDIADEDWIEDYLPITRVEPGRLWFGDVGPVTVRKAASELAEVGWDVTVVLARIRGTWQLVEVGAVYP